MLGPIKNVITRNAKAALRDSTVEKDPLIPEDSEYFSPPRVYADEDINAYVIIHNHMVDEYHHRQVMGKAMNRMYENQGEMQGEINIVKKIVIPVAISGIPLFIIAAIEKLGGI